MDPNADKQKRGTERGLKKGETFIEADESTKQRVRQNNTILNKQKKTKLGKQDSKCSSQLTLSVGGGVCLNIHYIMCNDKVTHFIKMYF